MSSGPASAGHPSPGGARASGAAAPAQALPGPPDGDEPPGIAPAIGMMPRCQLAIATPNELGSGIGGQPQLGQGLAAGLVLLQLGLEPSQQPGHLLGRGGPPMVPIEIVGGQGLLPGMVVCQLAAPASPRRGLQDNAQRAEGQLPTRFPPHTPAPGTH